MASAKALATLAIAVLLSVFTGVAAYGQYSQVPLDISGGFNMDSICGPREYQQCLIDGSHDFGELFGGMSSGNGVDVADSQGLAMRSNASDPANAYSIDGSSGHPRYFSAAEVFASDGVLHSTDRSYHLAGLTGNTTLLGNWCESANPANFDLCPNTIVVASAHNRNTWQIASVTVDLPAAQQDYYDDINFVINGFSSRRLRNISIVAIYADSSEDVLKAFSTDDTVGPVMDDPTSGGTEFNVIATAGYHYSLTTGATGAPRSLTNGLSYFEFASPLLLDNTKILTGLRFEDVNPDLNWAARGMAVWAATATKMDTSANTTPVADAGANQSIVDSDEDGFETVYLDAGASYDSDGQIISAVWTIDGIEVATGLNPVIELANGNYNITLTVDDNRGAVAADTIIVDIAAPGPGHPVADAGADQTLLDADNSSDEQVTLDGSASYDSDGTIVSYSWSEAGSEIATGASPTVTLATGSHAIRLTVTDDEGKIRYDDVTINILDWREPVTYHVAIDGDDANDGGEGSPFLTISHALGQVSFGDTVVLHEGIYRGGFGLPISGMAGYPITLRAADGEKAVISGARELTGWTACSSAAEVGGNANWADIYYVDLDFKPAGVYQDNQPVAVSRTEGWWHPADGGTTTTLYDPANITEPDDYWTGADIFIWFRTGTTHSHKTIVDQTGSTLTLDSDFGYSRTPDAEDFYWIENKVELIDGDGQYAIEDLGDGTYRLYLYPIDAADPAQCLIEGATSDDSFLINWSNKGYWIIDGLEVRHSANNGVGTWSDGGNHITIQNCQIHHNGGTGIYSRYNDDGVIRNNYTGYNGNGATTGGSARVLIEHNEIADNWYDGLIVSGDDVIVRENYVHGHYFWGHPDNIQTYGDVDNIYLESNLLFNGGQQLMMEDTNGVTLVNNMILFNRAYAIICGHDTTYDITLTGNTVYRPHYSSINTSGGFNYSVHDNFFGSGGGYRDTGTLDYDYNLYWVDGGRETIFNYSGSWNLTLSDMTSLAGQEANSSVADPMFANVPQSWIFPSTDNLTQNTMTRAYIDAGDVAKFAIGDYIELDMDGVVRTVTAVGADWIEWDVPEPRALIRVTGIANWKDNNDFMLDMSYQSGSPAIAAAHDGSNIGSDIDVQEFMAADFDGDGLCDVPRWGSDSGVQPQKPGDANGDDVVNLDDFIILKQNYGTTGASWSQGDFNGDGTVNLDDFIILKQNYGS